MFETIVIGAGQAGLAASYFLQRAGVHFLVLEAGAAPTGSWPRYYERLRLFSPARFSSLPGASFPGLPDRYPRRDEVSAYLQSYADRFQFPIRFHQEVAQVMRDETGFQVITATGEQYQARAIIVATGPFRQPVSPSFPGQDSFQGQIMHSADYVRPDPFSGPDKYIQITKERKKQPDERLAAPSERRPIHATRSSIPEAHRPCG